MSEGKVFCEKCRNDVAYTVATQQMEGIIEGKKYNYLGRMAYCGNCGSEIFIEEIKDYNLKELHKEYEKKIELSEELK